MFQRVNIIEAPYTRRSKTSALGSIISRLLDYVPADNLYAIFHEDREKGAPLPWKMCK